MRNAVKGIALFAVLTTTVVIIGVIEYGGVAELVQGIWAYLRLTWVVWSIVAALFGSSLLALHLSARRQAAALAEGSDQDDEDDDEAPSFVEGQDKRLMY